MASRYSESPVSDFEDGYSLYRDCLEQVYTLERIQRIVSREIISGRFLPPGARRGWLRPELAILAPGRAASVSAHHGQKREVRRHLELEYI